MVVIAAYRSISDDPSKGFDESLTLRAGNGSFQVDGDVAVYPTTGLRPAHSRVGTPSVARRAGKVRGWDA
jgi:hypothetical protein